MAWCHAAKTRAKTMPLHGNFGSRLDLVLDVVSRYAWHGTFCVMSLSPNVSFRYAGHGNFFIWDLSLDDVMRYARHSNVFVCDSLPGATCCLENATPEISF